MITTLVVSTLVCAIIWVVRYVRDYRAVTRELRSFPGVYIANPTPPTLAEISGDPRIPLEYRTHAASLGKRIVAGENPPTDITALWYDGPLLEDVEPAVAYDGPIKALMSPYESGCSGPHAATHGHLGGCALDTNPHYARGGPVMSGAMVIISRGLAKGYEPPSASLNPPPPTGCQHPNPEPVVLTTDEVVAGVCPDCLQPLPPASVGSEWKP